MGESGGLLVSGELSRSYGAVRTQNIMLSSIDSKSFSHKLEPSDTLQGLAVKYGISVERLKRVNKLWSNDSFHVKETLLIPCSKEDPEMSGEPMASLDSFKFMSDDDDDENECEEVEDEDQSEVLSSSCKENKEHLPNSYNRDNYKSDVMKCYDTIFSKIDGQIKEYKESEHYRVGSEAYNTFNEMLSKIDNQILVQKARNPPTDLLLHNEGGYQNVTFHNSYTSPKNCSSLSQGI